ncbi:MAG TPA: hypothetical protein VGS80_16010 [Ktedonobacterales bacterium]|nr:hypothetical protein [Ktedonobacterales bacterium]
MTKPPAAWQGVLPFTSAELVTAAAVGEETEREASDAWWREANVGGAVIDAYRGWSPPGAA